MITIAIRVREIISSNVDSLVSKAGEPRKMMRLLQSEIEEALIGLHGDAARARRQQSRLSDAAARLSASAESWTEKAKVALDHGREDLARAALLTREAERAKAVDAAGEAAAIEAQITEAADAIADLEAKRAAITACIAELERRARFADRSAAAPSPAAIDAELAALKASLAAPAKRAAGKKR